MQFQLKDTAVEKLKTECLVVGIFEEGVMTASAAAIDKATEGAIQRRIDQGDIDGKEKQTALLFDLPNIAAERVLVVGFGKSDTPLSAKAFSKLADSIAQQLLGLKIGQCTLSLAAVEVAERSSQWALSTATRAVVTAAYRYEDHKSEKSPKRKLKTITLHVENADDDTKQAIARAEAVANGINLARELGDAPPNEMNPSKLAKLANKLEKKHDELDVEVLSEKQMKSLGMGSLLSVSRGAKQPAKLISMSYNGGKKDQKPLVFVGKGVTFDSGGISLKPGAGMDEMKFDMCGAASVFGVIKACCELKLAINVVGVVPATENMPDSDATRPGDIVESMAGKTIEILNTDAEGRLILCDALTYVEKYDPEVVVDIATLTGACIIALGHINAAVLGNDDELMSDLQSAGKQVDDTCWPLPIEDAYKEQLKSNFADMANIGGRAAGTITAAAFLSHFTESYRWAHLDIAGVAWNSGAKKGATGKPVGMLMEYIFNQVDGNQ